jgi:hypothetical protein
VYVAKAQVFDQSKVLDAILTIFRVQNILITVMKVLLILSLRNINEQTRPYYNLLQLFGVQIQTILNWRSNLRDFGLFQRGYPIMEMTITKCLKRVRKYITHL